MLAQNNPDGRNTLATVCNKLYLPNSGLRFTAACFSGGGTAWSMKPLQKADDIKTNQAFVTDLQEALRSLGADVAYGPSPVNFNGEIIGQTDLSNTIPLGEHVTLYRSELVPADGTFLRSAGEAGLFSASGCGLIVAVLDDKMIFAHAGRDCLIDRARVLGNPRMARRKESVVDSIVEAFIEEGFTRADLHRLHAWMLYSIKPEEFLHQYDHVEYAPYNTRLRSYLERRGLGAGVRAVFDGVELDLPVIAYAQFMQYGVPGENIHLEHRYLHDELPTTRDTGGRYLVAVVRH